MPANEKYQANRGNDHDNNQASDSSKKAAKVAAKGAADYFTGGKGGAIVDKLADTKLGNQMLDKAGKIIDNNPKLKKAAESLDKKGALDTADKGLSMAESGGAAGDSSGKNFGLEREKINDAKASNYQKENDSSETEQGNMAQAPFSFEIPPIFKTPKAKIIAGAVGVVIFFIFGFVIMIAGSDEDGTDPDELAQNGTNGGSYCITDNLQASELCKLHNQGKLEEWVKMFGPVAQKDYSRTGVFASITTAQAIIESFWACSDIHNNLFGIKCHGYPTCTSVGTHEEVNGQSVAITDSFRTYESVANSIEDHSKFLHDNSRYTTAGVFSSRDYKEQAQALKSAGYATASNYASSLINIIEQYNLNRFDVVVNTTSTAACGGGGGGAGSSTISGWTIRGTKPISSDKAFTYKSSNRGQCVWYAQARAIEIVEELKEKGKLDASTADEIKNRLLNTYGNGGDWYDVTRGKFKGSNKVKDVKAGSLISWKKPGGYGHVAVIEDVTDDSVMVSDGFATNGSSCPNSWSCVNFNKRTYSMDEWKSVYGKTNGGNYYFSGYVYFLELEG